MRRVLSLIVIFCLALAAPAADAKKPKKKVRWTPIPHQQYQTEAEVGALLTCTYKVVDAGQRFESIHEETGLKVVVTKPAGGDLKFTLYWNHKLPRKQIDNEKVAEALQNAVGACFEKLYDEHDGD